MLTDDYVWDQTGEAEPDVRAWEQALQTVRHRTPMRHVSPPMVEAAPQTSWAKPVIYGALLSSTLTVLLIWGFVRLGPGAPAQSVDEIASVQRTSVAVSGPPQGQGASKPERPAASKPRAVAPSSEADTDARLAEIESALEAIQSTLAELSKAIKGIEQRTRAPQTPRPSSKRRAIPAPGSPLTIDKILAPSPREKSPRARDTHPAGERKRASARPVPGKDVLSHSDIKSGILPHWVAAKRCIVHGGLPGQKVVVRMSIDGATGRVSGIRAIGVHAGTPLGKCVANALARARFPKFSKSSLGVQYPIRL